MNTVNYRLCPRLTPTIFMGLLSKSKHSEASGLKPGNAIGACVLMCLSFIAEIADEKLIYLVLTHNLDISHGES